MGKGTVIGVAAVTIVGGTCYGTYKLCQKLKHLLEESGEKSSSRERKSHRAPTKSPSVGAQHDVPNSYRQTGSSYQSTYDAQPATYRDRLATQTQQALDHGDFETANKMFNNLTNLDGWTYN